MPNVKSLISSIKVNVGGTLAALIIKFLHLTIRWQWHGLDNLNLKGEGPDDPRICALWHNRQILNFGIYFAFQAKYPKNSVYGLISAHDDGRLIARAIGWLGMRSIKGSSTRGGFEAMIEMVRRAKEGNSLVITPDGPKGPPCVVKPGIINLARLSGLPITPVGLAVERYWVIPSWDRLIIPKPFSKGVGFIGEPFMVPRELAEEEFDTWALLLTDKMNEVVHRADSFEYR